MSNIHLVLQGKGGVGKSYVSSIIAQHQLSKEKKLVCLDTDPVNKTFFQYSALNVQKIELMEEMKINNRNFDQLITLLMDDGDFVIDNGAASFIPLSNYLLENNVMGVLNEMGKTVYIHTVITGGQGTVDTVNGLQTLIERFGEHAKIICWLNHFFGPIEYNGKSFEQMKVYQNNKDKIEGMITISQKTSETFGYDVKTMLQNKLTFNEAIESPDFQLMAKQRIKIVQRELWQQLDTILG